MKTPQQKRLRAYRAGIIAEYLAALLLILKGYRILEHRYRCRQGEIDLIAGRGPELVFVEVKTRASPGDALEAVGAAGRKRITRAAENYMRGVADAGNRPVRFDVIALSPPCKVVHVRNAWFAGT